MLVDYVADVAVEIGEQDAPGVQVLRLGRLAAVLQRRPGSGSRRTSQTPRAGSLWPTTESLIPSQPVSSSPCLPVVLWVSGSRTLLLEMLVCILLHLTVHTQLLLLLLLVMVVIVCRFIGYRCGRW